MRLVIANPIVLSLLGAAALVACSSSSNPGGGLPDASTPDATTPDAAPTPDAAGDAGSDSSDLLPTPPAWDQPVTRPTDPAAAMGRANCQFARGDMPAKTLGTSTPIDMDIPIENIVIVMMENRSFDSMFGHLNEYGNRTDVEEPPAGASNPTNAAGGTDGGTDAGSPDAGSTDAGASDSGVADAGPTEGGAIDGGDAGTVATHPWTHAPLECFADTDHSWKGQHWAWDNGLNDGFFAENSGTMPAPMTGNGSDGERAMWFYDQTDLPFEYQLANTFAIADHYFCSLLGPTGPNRMYLVAGTSMGLTDNSIPGNVSPNIVDNVVVPDELEQRHVTWKLYSDGTPSLAIVLTVGIVTRYPERTRFAFSDFLKDAQNGTLPQVSWVDPKVGTADGTVGNNDDHPPGDVQIGSQFLNQVYRAITTSPQWAHTALFITWDENGGEYDHVPPPPACAPDTTAPILNGTDVGIPGDFTRYGFRVPLLVVSPYAKKAFASHKVYDHASIARFIEAKFKIPALTARDANADALTDLFDFTTPALLTPPSIPAPSVNDAGLQTCTQMFGP
jgi:phospholipase C